MLGEACLLQELLRIHVIYFFNGLEIGGVVEMVTREVELALATTDSVCVEVLHCVHFYISFLATIMGQVVRTDSANSLRTSFSSFLGP